MTAPRPDLAVVEELRDELRANMANPNHCADCKLSSARDKRRADAIDALLAERAAHEWRPIETAPRDGEAVLLYWHPEPKEIGIIECCYWDDEKLAWVIACECAGIYRHPAGYTHWLPLPAAPQPKGPEDEA